MLMLIKTQQDFDCSAGSQTNEMFGLFAFHDENKFNKLEAIVNSFRKSLRKLPENVLINL